MPDRGVPGAAAGHRDLLPHGLLPGPAPRLRDGEPPGPPGGLQERRRELPAAGLPDGDAAGDRDGQPGTLLHRHAAGHDLPDRDEGLRHVADPAGVSPGSGRPPRRLELRLPADLLRAVPGDHGLQPGLVPEHRRPADPLHDLSAAGGPPVLPGAGLPLGSAADQRDDQPAGLPRRPAGDLREHPGPGPPRRL
eukprot:TRINITY_DN4507_c0_g1_i1.p3 TRINITY_DN4507_c0_g1~~TRINITY_DN4507_c0_g1_i1.p3  ORF type:complete len:193 (-),score=-3.89 TRINITY_DN4507_c0_g1_i1:38-616(-)